MAEEFTAWQRAWNSRHLDSFFAMCCFSYISMVMFGHVYCFPHAYCVLHDIIQHIYKVFHQLKQCTASYDWLRLVKTGPLQDWSGLVQDRSRDCLDWSWSQSLPKKAKDWTGLSNPILTTSKHVFESTVLVARFRAKCVFFGVIYFRASADTQTA